MDRLPSSVSLGWGEKVQDLRPEHIDLIFDEWEDRVRRNDGWCSLASFQYSVSGDYQELQVSRCLTEPEAGYFVIHTTSPDPMCRVIECSSIDGTVEVEDSAFDRYLVRRSYIVPPSMARQAVHYFAANGLGDPSLPWVSCQVVDPQFD